VVSRLARRHTTGVLHELARRAGALPEEAAAEALGGAMQPLSEARPRVAPALLGEQAAPAGVRRLGAKLPVAASERPTVRRTVLESVTVRKRCCSPWSIAEHTLQAP